LAAGSGGLRSDRHGVLSIIRRWALREHLSIREIARRTKLSRNTIRSYLRSGAVEPRFSVPERPGKLDPHATKLLGWLKTEAGKSRKERRTAKQLHEDLVKLGYTGSYGRVAAFARMSRARKRSGGSFSRRLGGQIVKGNSRRRGAEPLCRSSFNRARRSSLTGAKTSRCWVESAPSCRWRISNCRTAGLFCCGPIHCRPMTSAIGSDRWRHDGFDV